MGANTLNGRKEQKTPVLEPELITDSETLEAVETTEAPVVTPQEKEASPKRKKLNPLILAGLGVGAIVAGTFGYHYWQYTSTHQETDNATVAGNIHQISSRIPGTVSEVLVNDNQLVQPGQLLVKLDPRDYESKVQQAQAALENARGQAQAAQANISLSSQTTTGKTTQAQGDVSSA
jgi:membrane fusion protein, multidrug efflux system